MNICMQRTAVLINPPPSGSHRSKIMLGDSLSLSAIAQVMLSKNWKPIVLDCFLHDWSINDLLNKIPRHIDFVGITIMSSNAKSIVEILIQKIREINPNIHISIGGSAATLNPDLFYGLDINSLVTGDDIRQIEKLINDYEINRIKNNGLTFKKKYTSEMYSTYTYTKIFRPDISLAFKNDRVISLESSKGCYGKCNFCSVNFEHLSSWIPRDINSVVDEIKYIKLKVPDCSQVRFVDANFLGGREKYLSRTILISESLKEENLKFRIECRIDDVEFGLFEKLKENGLVGVFLGIENGQQHILNSLSKNINSDNIMFSIDILKKLKISYSFGFIMVTPLTTENDVLANVSLLKSITYGIRWKHLFSGLIIQKNRNDTTLVQPKTSYEEKLGYACKDVFCSKLLHFHDICLRNYLPVLELENVIGIAIERGKESEQEWFWNLDKTFSKICIDIFSALIYKLKCVDNTSVQIQQLANKYMHLLDNNLKQILKEIKNHGLSESTMLKPIKDYIW